jgi:hypothetical protein
MGRSLHPYGAGPMRLCAALLKPARSDSNPLAPLDFFDADGSSPGMLRRVLGRLRAPSTWRASSTYPTGTLIERSPLRSCCASAWRSL